MSLEDRAAQLSEQAANFFKLSAVSGMAGLGLNDILQTLALVVSITAGLLAIKHYRVSIKLNNMKIKEHEDIDQKKVEGWD